MIRSRFVAGSFSLAVCVAAAYPSVLPLSEDSFPLSTYPMFASRRGKPMIHRAEAVLEGDGTWVIPPELIAGGEALQAKVILRKAVERRGRMLSDLCRQLASRVAERRSDAQRVEIVGVRFDPIAYFTTGPEPVDRRVYAKCRAPRRQRDANEAP